jgi:hypothetical protein
MLKINFLKYNFLIYFRSKNNLKYNHYYNIRRYTIKYPLLMRKNTQAIGQVINLRLGNPKIYYFAKNWFFFYFFSIFKLFLYTDIKINFLKKYII